MKPLLLSLMLLLSPVITHAEAVPADQLYTPPAQLTTNLPGNSTTSSVTTLPALAEWQQDNTADTAQAITPPAITPRNAPNPVSEPGLVTLLALGSLAFLITARRRAAQH